MTRTEYVDILIADGRPEDAEELQRLILEEIDEVIDMHNESLKSSEDFDRRFRARQLAIDQAKPRGLA